LREKRRLRVFENRVLRRILGPERYEVKREWRKLHIEELNNLYSSTNIFRVIKSRIMRWAGHVAHIGNKRGVYRFWWGNLMERDYLEDPGAAGTIILNWIFKTWLEAWTGFTWVRRGTGGRIL